MRDDVLPLSQVTAAGTASAPRWARILLVCARAGTFVLGGLSIAVIVLLLLGSMPATRQGLQLVICMPLATTIACILAWRKPLIGGVAALLSVLAFVFQLGSALLDMGDWWLPLVIAVPGLLYVAYAAAVRPGAVVAASN